MDIMLPEIDGISLTRWLRDRSDVPIIMVTARREEVDRVPGLEMEQDSTLVKPFSPQVVEPGAGGIAAYGTGSGRGGV